MRDIVATIQSDQYRLITAEPEGALVVQGGPGTGKTAVGLHRASWLLYTHREQLRRVLVVGPNPTFMDYVSHVLPALGEEAVEQRAVSELLDGIVVGARGGARRRAAEGGHAARRGRDARSRARGAARAAGARALRRRGVRLRARARGRRAARRGARVRTRRWRWRASASGWRCCAASTSATARSSAHVRCAAFDELERALQQQRLPREVPRPRARAAARRRSSSRGCSRRRRRSPRRPRASSRRDEQKLLLRDRPKRAAELRWSDHDLPLLDDARTLVDGRRARTGT